MFGKIDVEIILLFQRLVNYADRYFNISRRMLIIGSLTLNLIFVLLNAFFGISYLITLASVDDAGPFTYFRIDFISLCVIGGLCAAACVGFSAIEPDDRFVADRFLYRISALLGILYCGVISLMSIPFFSHYFAFLMCSMVSEVVTEYLACTKMPPPKESFKYADAFSA